jgi:ACS family hexuronate transporter-like MFS transporter
LQEPNSTNSTGRGRDGGSPALRRDSRGTVPAFRWWIAGLLFLCTALSFFDRQVLSVLAPTVMRDLGMDNTQYANVVAAFVLSYSLMFAVGGRFLDWVGTRRGMLICVSLWTVASAAHAWARSAWQLGAFRFLLGVGEGGCFPGVTKAALEWFPLRQRSRAIGFAIGGAAIGAVLAPPLATWMVGHVGWRGAFLATGAFGATWVLLWALFYRLPRHSPFVSARELALIEEDSPAGSAPADDAAGLLSWSELLRLRPVWGLLLTRFLLDPVMYLYMFWIPQYLSTAHSATLADIGRLAWIPFLTLDVANMLGGFVSDRLVRAGWSIGAARKTVMGVAAMLTPISILAMYVDRMDVAVGLMSVQMFAHGFWITNYITLTGDLLPPRSVGTVVGLCGCAGGLSGFLTTKLVGMVVDRFTFVPVFVAAGVMYPIGFLVILLTIGRVQRIGVPTRAKVG